MKSTPKPTEAVAIEAAHAEVGAKEVTRQVSEACGCGSVDCPERIKVVAAALAACARESEKPFRRVVEAAKAVDDFYVYLDSTIAPSANGARVAIQILRDELRALQARNE